MLKAVEAGDKAAAQTRLPKGPSEVIDRIADKGVFHKNKQPAIRAVCLPKSKSVGLIFSAHRLGVLPRSGQVSE